MFSGEAIALATAFDEAFTLRHDLHRFLRRYIPIALRMDSLALFEAISRNAPPKEHRWCIDLAQIMESWRRQEISQLAFVRSDENIADSLTKATSQNLNRSFDGFDYAILTQWIDRDHAV